MEQQEDKNITPLLSAFKRGDEKAFRHYFDTYYNALCLFALRLVRDEEEARDIVQDVFIHLWEARATIQSELHLRMYVYQAARHRCVNYLKAKSVKEEALEDYARSQSEEECRDRVAEEEVYRLVMQEIDRLPKEQRKVILLHLEGKNNLEIADILRVSVTTVKTHKIRARQQLKHKLKDFFLLSTILGL